MRMVLYRSRTYRWSGRHEHTLAAGIVRLCTGVGGFVPLEWVVDSGRVDGSACDSERRVLWAFGGLPHLQTWIQHRESGTVLALFRVLGFCVLWTVFTVVRVDLVDVLWVHEEHGGTEVTESFWLVYLLGGPAPSVIWGLTIAAMACGVLMMLGVGAIDRVWGIADLYGRGYQWSCRGQLRRAVDQRVVGGWRRRPIHSPSIGGCSAADFGRSFPSWPGALFARLSNRLGLLDDRSAKVSTYWVPGGDFSALYYILSSPPGTVST